MKINNPTLRELLILNSLYYCSTQTEILDIVNDQPNPSIFYKSLLELDGSNMVSIMSFDSNSMEFLLDGKFKEFFSEKYPLFYNNKILKGNGKYYYRNAIENALKCNQVRAVDKIMQYIINY